MTKTNGEIEMYGNDNTLGVVKAQRLRWLGHIQRTNDSRLPKKIINTKIGEKRIEEHLT